MDTKSANPGFICATVALNIRNKSLKWISLTLSDLDWR